MAVLLRMKFDGGTSDQYDAVHKGLGIEENPPEGLIFHSAGPREDGFGIVDVWESRGHFDKFAEGRLGPQLAELGDAAFAGPPDIAEYPVHNYDKP